MAKKYSTNRRRVECLRGKEHCHKEDLDVEDSIKMDLG